MCIRDSAYPDRTAMALGLHPTSVEADYAEQLRQLRQYRAQSSEAIVAIGEIGLDFYWDRTYAEEQQRALIEQVGWATELDLPVILHVRSALDETIDLLTSHFAPEKLRGVFHCFEGEETQLQRILDHLPLMMIGVNGNVTYKRSRTARLLSQIPLDKMILETDAPYLAPIPQRGKRNEDVYKRQAYATCRRASATGWGYRSQGKSLSLGRGCATGSLGAC